MNRQLYQFFGLQENPFGMSPYPSFLLVNRKTQSILDDLAEGIQSGKGLLLLTGEAGTGKTTLVKRLMEWLKQRGTPAAFIFNARLEPAELFEMALDSYGVLANKQLRGTPRQRLNQWLIERNAAGVRPVLIIDEAQGLPVSALEELRLLLNQELMGERVIQIVLSGHPELNGLLKSHELRHLRQRIELRRNTAAFDPDESRGYIQKRLDVAGAHGQSVFPAETAEAVYFYAHGVPRVMNLLCEHGLRRAYEHHSHSVAPEMVDEVARELQFDECRPAVRRESRIEIPDGTGEEATARTVEVPVSSGIAAAVESAAPEPFIVATEGWSQLPERPPTIEAQPAENLHVLQPLPFANSVEPPAQSRALLPTVETTAITRTPETSALCVAPSTELAHEEINTTEVTAIVRSSPQRYWIEPRRETLELRLTQAIAALFNHSWQKWRQRCTAVGRWLCGPMPFGHRRVRRAVEQADAV
jgi:general secretion pathway protein A